LAHRPRDIEAGGGQVKRTVYYVVELKKLSNQYGWIRMDEKFQTLSEACERAGNYKTLKRVLRVTEEVEVTD
jgi:hypothetical protein